jgi:hypothetical protein
MGLRLILPVPDMAASTLQSAASDPSSHGGRGFGLLLMGAPIDQAC